MIHDHLGQIGGEFDDEVFGSVLAKTELIVMVYHVAIDCYARHLCCCFRWRTKGPLDALIYRSLNET